MQHDELLNEIYSNINKKLILQGLTIEKNSKLVLQKINKYAKKVIKYINKKELKKDSKSNKKLT